MESFPATILHQSQQSCSGFAKNIDKYAVEDSIDVDNILKKCYEGDSSSPEAEPHFDTSLSVRKGTR